MGKRGLAKWTWRSAGALMSLCLGVVFLPVTEIRAVFDSSTAVHIKPDEIEKSTLIIGTHLIFLEVMTDQIYEDAKTSASDSGQNIIYYRSEFSDSGWYEVDNAKSLEDIRDTKKAVPDPVIEGLNMTHHTKSDGITYDLRTGQAVNVSDLTDPYDFLMISELSALADHYKYLEEEGGGPEEVTDILKEFFDTGKEKEGEKDKLSEDGVRDRTEMYDNAVDTLYRYSAGLGGAKGDTQIKTAVNSVMEKADDKRRTIVLSYAAGLLRDAAGKVSAIPGGSETASIIQECLGSMEISISTAEEEKKDSSAINLAQEEIFEKIMDEAGETGGENLDEAGLAEALKKYSVLEKFTDGIYDDTDEMIKLLDGTILPLAEKAYKDEPGERTEGELSLYKEIRESLAAGDEEAGTAEKELEELKSQIDKLKEERLNALGKQELSKADELKEKVLELDIKIQSMGGSPEDALQMEKLKQNAVSAAGDEERTDELDADIEAVGTLSAIWPVSGADALNEILAGIKKERLLKSDDTLYKEQAAKIEALLIKCSEAEGQDNKNSEILSVLEAGGSALNGSDLRKDAAGILGLAIYNGQIDTEALDAFSSMDVGGSEEEGKSAGGSDSENDKPDSIGKPGAGNKDAEGAGGESDGENPGKTGSEELLEEKAMSLAEAGESPAGFIFRADINKREGNEVHYVPADTLAAFVSMRYIWNRSQRQAILANGGEYYRFEAFSDTVDRGSEKKDTLGEDVWYDKKLYIPADYVLEEFECMAVRIQGTGYAVLADKEMIQSAEEMKDSLSDWSERGR